MSTEVGSTSRDYDGTWVPRIGAKATEELRRSRKLVLIVWPTMIAVMIAGSFAFNSAPR